MKKTKLEAGPFVLPMPVALVGAEVEGRANFMVAAFVGIANFKPPTIACALSPSHHTCQGILLNRSFSINLPGPDLLGATDWCGINSGKRHDKSKVFKTFSGNLSGAPMISECSLTAECKLIKKVEFDVDTVYFGEIVSVYVDDDAVLEGAPDWRKIAPLLFTFPDKGYWKLGDYLGPAWSVGKDHFEN